MSVSRDWMEEGSPWTLVYTDREFSLYHLELEVMRNVPPNEILYLFIGD